MRVISIYLGSLSTSDNLLGACVTPVTLSYNYVSHLYINLIYNCLESTGINLKCYLLSF